MGLRYLLFYQKLFKSTDRPASGLLATEKSSSVRLNLASSLIISKKDILYKLTVLLRLYVLNDETTSTRTELGIRSKLVLNQQGQWMKPHI